MDSIKRFNECMNLYIQAKAGYMSFFKIMKNKEFLPLIGEYGSLQFIYLYTENTLFLQFTILIDSDAKLGIQKVINCLKEESKITKEQHAELFSMLPFDHTIEKKIKRFRDCYIAHIDLKAIQNAPDYLSPEEFDKLMVQLEEILSKIMRFVNISIDFGLSFNYPFERVLRNLKNYRLLQKHKPGEFMAMVGEVLGKE